MPVALLVLVGVPGTEDNVSRLHRLGAVQLRVQRQTGRPPGANGHGVDFILPYAAAFSPAVLNGVALPDEQLAPVLRLPGGHIHVAQYVQLVLRHHPVVHFTQIIDIEYGTLDIPEQAGQETGDVSEPGETPEPETPEPPEEPATPAEPTAAQRAREILENSRLPVIWADTMEESVDKLAVALEEAA